MSVDEESELIAIVREFLIESRDNLDQFELALLELESDPVSERSLQSAFRSIHSIKGCCGFLGFAKIEAITHSGEALLGQVRDGRLRLDLEITNALLVMVDAIRRMLSDIEATGSEGDIDVSTAIDQLTRATYPAARSAGAAHPSMTGPITTARPEDLRALAPTDTKIRVDTLLLDRLMNLVGELVLARNQVAQLTASQQGSSVSVAAQRLSVITTEIQEVAMKTRMLPLGTIWSRFPRMVRELGRTCEKRVRIVMDGQQTELDRSLIEAIQDPLTHLVRNAVDHGIEAPDLRARLGKPEIGEVTLRAFHAGGMVNIEISDDGRGLETASIRQKALARGLVVAENVDRMSDRELHALIFLPGFSTQETVSNVSGRGVGLDVVKTKIEQIGGTVEVQNRAGKGVTFRLKIPLTLAIIPALIVSDGGERYAIPQASLVEVLRLSGDKAERQIELIQGTPVLRLRGKLLPLAFLGRELDDEHTARSMELAAVVVLQANDRSFGLVVEDINDTEEIVVKPIWKRLKGLACYAGATVMGDGRVALILDAFGLAQRVGVIEDDQDGHRHASKTLATSEAQPERLEQVLLCTLGQDGRIAIPLSKVARLEKIDACTIERLGGLEVVQYRGKILPLVRLANVLEERRTRPRGRASEGPVDGDTVEVVVYADAERSVGLIIDSILDIVELPIDLQRAGARACILGSMVVQGRVTEFLDVEGALERMDTRTKLFGAQSAPPVVEGSL